MSANQTLNALLQELMHHPDSRLVAYMVEMARYINELEDRIDNLESGI